MFTEIIYMLQIKNCNAHHLEFHSLYHCYIALLDNQKTGEKLDISVFRHITDKYD